MSLPTTDDLISLASAALAACGAPPLASGDGPAARSPITGGRLGAVTYSSDVDAAVDRATEAFAQWRTTPAPLRGELIRLFGMALREQKADLARLVQIEIVCSDKSEHRKRLESRLPEPGAPERICWTKHVVNREYEPWHDRDHFLDTAGRTSDQSYTELRRLLALPAS